MRKAYNLGLKVEYSQGKGNLIHDWLGEIMALKMLPRHLALNAWNRRLRGAPTLIQGQYRNAIVEMVHYFEVRYSYTCTIIT